MIMCANKHTNTRADNMIMCANSIWWWCFFKVVSCHVQENRLVISSGLEASDRNSHQPDQSLALMPTTQEKSRARCTGHLDAESHCTKNDRCLRRCNHNPLHSWPDDMPRIVRRRHSKLQCGHLWAPCGGPC